MKTLSIASFFIFIFSLTTQAACSGAGNLCQFETCCGGLECKSFFEKSSYASPTCLEAKKICAIDTDCCSGLCFKDPETALTGECTYEHRCLAPLGKGTVCLPGRDLCSNSRCLPVWDKSVLIDRTCYQEGVHCLANAECCSNLCQSGVCAKLHKCQDCAPSGEVPNPGQICCEGLIKKSGACAEKSLTFNLIHQVIDLLFSKAFAASDCVLAPIITPKKIDDYADSYALDAYLIGFEYTLKNSKGQDYWTISYDGKTQSIHEWLRYFAGKLEAFRVTRKTSSTNTSIMTKKFCGLVHDPNSIPLAELKTLCPEIINIYGFEGRKIKKEETSDGIVIHSLGACLQANLKIEYAKIRHEFYGFFSELYNTLKKVDDVVWKSRAFQSDLHSFNYCHSNHELLKNLSQSFSDTLHLQSLESAKNSINLHVNQLPLLESELYYPTLASCQMTNLDTATNCADYSCTQVNITPNVVCSKNVPASFCTYALYERADTLYGFFPKKLFPYLLDPVIPSAHIKGASMVGLTFEDMNLFGVGYKPQHNWSDTIIKAILKNTTLKLADDKPLLYNDNAIFDVFAEQAYKWNVLLPGLSKTMTYPSDGLFEALYLLSEAVVQFGAIIYQSEESVYRNYKAHAEEAIFALGSAADVYKTQYKTDTRNYLLYKAYLESNNVKNEESLSIIDDVQKTGKAGMLPVKMNMAQLELTSDAEGYQTIIKDNDKRKLDFVKDYGPNGNIVLDDYKLQYDQMMIDHKKIVEAYKNYLVNNPPK